MNQIQELREKRAKAWDAAKAFLDTKRGNDGLLSAEDVATYDKMEIDVVNLGKEIDRLERQAALDAELNKPTADPLTNKPVANSMDPKSGRASDEYKKAFWNVMRAKNPRYDVVNALQIGTDSEGGYLAPDEFDRTLVDALEEENIFRTLARVIQTSSGDRKIPVVTTHGSASWLDEEELVPESDEAFGQTSIGAFKLGTFIKVSDELLNDSVFDLQSYITTEFARRIGHKEEEAFFVGDAAGKCGRSGYSGIQAIKFTSNTSFSGDAYLNGGWDSIFVYVRVRKVGVSYSLDMSADGDFWWEIFTETISNFLSAISHVGVGYFRNNTSGVTYKGRCDWFRVTEEKQKVLYVIPSFNNSDLEDQDIGTFFEVDTKTGELPRSYRIERPAILVPENSKYYKIEDRGLLVKFIMEQKQELDQ